MAGTNDIAWWTAQTDMGKVADKMMALVDDVLAKHGEVGVIVGTIAPMSSKVAASVNRDRAELTNEFNQALKAKVSGHAASGTRLWLADVNAKLTLADLYDGIHPTRAGHDKVANAWLEVLEPLLP
jgi:lysophospholipase L1-like esterase